MCEISGEFFIFKQDSVPAHWARETTSFLETPAFISPDMWCVAPNSIHSNPIDYKIWGEMQQRGGGLPDEVREAVHAVPSQWLGAKPDARN